MNRVEAISRIVADHPEAAIVFSNGLTSREAAHRCDRPGNLYLLHGMGEALSVGMGLKAACPGLEVVVVEGDGNAAMGLSATALMPFGDLVYYVLDNHVHETTGGQAAPRLPFKAPWMRVLEIEAGAIGAPNPPPPESFMPRFREFVRSHQTKVIAP